MGSEKQSMSARKLCVERNTTHGMSGTQEYQIWKGLITRCYNKNKPLYKNYGGRGIAVCDSWRKSFLAFFEDMGKRPSKEHSLDRIDNNGNYEPGNCRWATKLQQNRNSRRNCVVVINGISKTISEWSEISGVPQKSIQNRLARGWEAKPAVFTAIDQSMTGWSMRVNGESATVNGWTMTLKDWARQPGSPSYNTIKKRIRAGMTPEEAIRTPTQRSSGCFI